MIAIDCWLHCGGLVLLMAGPEGSTVLHPVLHDLLHTVWYGQLDLSQCWNTLNQQAV
jgi:hypothetical protein